MPFAFVDEVEEDIVDASTNGRTKVEEFAVYSVECGLEEVTFPGVFGVEQLEEIEDKGLVNVSLGQVGVEVWALDKSQEKFVYNFEVWPCEFQNWLVFLWVVGISGWIDRRGYRTEEIDRKLRCNHSV